MVFIAVGTTLFDALVRAVDAKAVKQELFRKGYTDLLTQMGWGSYTLVKVFTSFFFFIIIIHFILLLLLARVVLEFSTQTFFCFGVGGDLLLKVWLIIAWNYAVFVFFQETECQLACWKFVVFLVLS